MSATIGIGVIGLGYSGRTHIHAWNALARRGLACRLVAVADASSERLSGRAGADGNLPAGGPPDLARGEQQVFDPALVRGYTDAAELLADPEVAIVSVCTPTETHVELARRALAAGKHVLVEKPVAITSRAIEPLLADARAARTLCLPAMCMRFWPGWDWLRESIVEKSFGAVRSAVFQRLASAPAWSAFYGDPTRSGGALCDLHVHDADFVRWCFGEPEEVRANGDLDHLTALYRFAKGPPHVVAEGGWNHTSGFGFRMRFVVVFEQATAEFELGRTPALKLFRGGTSEAVALGAESAYEAQARHLLEAVQEGNRELRASVEDASRTVRLLEAERESLMSGRSARVR